jgi:hypothetical protein
MILVTRSTVESYNAKMRNTLLLLLPSLVVVIVSLATFVRGNFFHDIGNQIENAMRSLKCKCPESMAGKIRCGYEINDAVGNARGGESHCDSRVVYACDISTMKSRSGRTKQHVLTNRLDHCEKKETCVADGEDRYCEYTRRRKISIKSM